MTALRSWWTGRSVREQRMLLVLAALLAVTVAWFGVVGPLDRALADARERHGRAVIAHAAVAADAAALGAVDGATAATGSIEERVQRSATEAGFGIARAEPGGQGQVALTFDAVRAAPFFAWVDRLGREGGLVVDAVDARANSDATLGVRLTVRERGR